MSTHDRTATRMALVAALWVCGCGPGPEAEGRKVVLGVVIDRTGNNSEPSWVDAIKLARRHANVGLKSAEYKDMQFQLEIADSGNEPTVAFSRAYGLLDKGAKALILDTSQNDIIVNRAYYDSDTTNDPNVPLLCGSCTGGTLNNPTATDTDPVTQLALRNSKRWNFRSVMSTKQISQVLVRIMLETSNGDVNGDGVMKVSFLGSDEAFGRGGAKDLKSFLTSLHPTPAPILEELYHPRDADVNSYAWGEDMKKLTDTLNQNTGSTDGAPDFIVICNFAQQQAASIKAYRQAGTAVRMLHYHSMRFSTVLSSLGSLADGAEGVSHVLVEEGGSGQSFADEFLQLYGVNVQYRDSTYYDGAMSMMLAAVIASVSRQDPSTITGDELRDAMFKTSVPGGERIGVGPAEFERAVRLIVQGTPIDYAGASGPLDYDANGNVVSRLARFRAEAGQFKDTARFDCVGNTQCPLMQ